MNPENYFLQCFSKTVINNDIHISQREIFLHTISEKESILENMDEFHPCGDVKLEAHMSLNR